MSREHIVLMNVVDDERYALYRAEMYPILKRYGGGFKYDFKVSESLTSETDHPVTRIFLIYFSDSAASEAFFKDPEYLDVKREHYEGAVQGHTVLVERDT